MDDGWAVIQNKTQISASRQGKKIKITFYYVLLSTEKSVKSPKEVAFYQQIWDELEWSKPSLKSVPKTSTTQATPKPPKEKQRTDFLNRQHPPQKHQHSQKSFKKQWKSLFSQHRVIPIQA
jgi:hypothetical protein